ncbi:carboxypeptidase-like regulatory domain-containing protein [Paenarthrobacter nitroguajacolicus]|uniref:carboxypeptidase-like regulatory domain-containing protein n=1 Tax=Paenarthrobacter nitroguajacolicus TaxID=211146 RepID=UPI003D2434A9
MPLLNSTTAQLNAAATQSDGRGRYAIEAATGTYTLTPSAPGYNDGVPVALTLSDGETTTTPLKLGATTATTGTVTGTISSSRAGLAGATVAISKGAQELERTMSDASGRYVCVDVLAGTG